MDADPTILRIMGLDPDEKVDGKPMGYYFRSSYDVECDACGHCATVEPDADYECYECGEGRLTSPLVEEGLI